MGAGRCESPVEKPGDTRRGCWKPKAVRTPKGINSPAEINDSLSCFSILCRNLGVCLHTPHTHILCLSEDDKGKKSRDCHTE